MNCRPTAYKAVALPLSYKGEGPRLNQPCLPTFLRAISNPGEGKGKYISPAPKHKGQKSAEKLGGTGVKKILASFVVGKIQIIFYL